jgi:hypothetical protein
MGRDPLSRSYPCVTSESSVFNCHRLIPVRFLIPSYGASSWRFWFFFLMMRLASLVFFKSSLVDAPTAAVPKAK